MNTFWLYIVTLRMNDKSYVGWTDDIVYRWQRHKRDAFNGSKTYFHRAIKKYGVDAFSWDVVQCFDSAEEAKQAEIFWIAELNTNHCQGGFGFNSTSGGDGSGGHKMDEETKLRQSQRLKALGESHPSKRSEVKSKMSVAQLAKGEEHPSKRSDVRAKNSAAQRAKGQAHQSRRSAWRTQHSERMRAKGDEHASKRPDVREKMRIAQSGEEGNAAKLNWEKVEIIRTSSESDITLSKMYNVTKETIWNVRRFKTWIPNETPA